MRNPHVLVIPYPAIGHVLPLLELSYHLLTEGLNVMFVTTRIADLELVKNAFPSKPFAGFQVKELSGPDTNSSAAILQVMPAKVEELIDEMSALGGDRISCVIVDQTIGWALEVAEKKGIRRAAFCPAAAATLVLEFSIPKLIEDGIIDEIGTPRKKQLMKISPTMPAMDTTKFLWACIGSIEAQKTIFGLMVRNIKSIKSTDWLLCNSSYSLEPAAFDHAPNIIPVGPILASNSPEKILTEDSDSCIQWLDQQAPKSVVYVAFGSTMVLKPTQFEELATGLELSNRPFLWAIRQKPESTSEFFREFQGRTRTHGRIVAWAPQQNILRHDSVACFVSHCGWNSVLEGASNGVPFLCWPYIADQFFNQNYVCNIWKIGLGFERDANGVISREEIASKIDEVMRTEKIKERALKIKGMVMDCVEIGGKSYQNFKKFVEWLKTK